MVSVDMVNGTLCFNKQENGYICTIGEVEMNVLNLIMSTFSYI